MNQKLKNIDASYLKQFPEFVEFQNLKSDENITENISNHSEILIQTSEEILEETYQNIRKSLAQELLDRITKFSPIFFERLIVELLVKMGY